MNIKIIPLIISISFIALSGCSGNTSGNAVTPSTAINVGVPASSQNTIDALKTPDSEGKGEKSFEYNDNFSKKQFLWVNGIKVNEIVMENAQKDGQFYMSRINYPQIEGLKDSSVESSINEELKRLFFDYAEGKYISESDIKKLDIGMCGVYYNVQANYNNILSIRAARYLSHPEVDKMPEYPITFDLNTGRKLTLEDLFYTQSDYIDIINNEISRQIVERNIDEYSMQRPFKGIGKDQLFYIDDTKLVIEFEPGNPYFKNSYMVYGDGYYMNPYMSMGFYIPLEKLKGTFRAYDEYWDSSKNLYDTNIKKKKMISEKFTVQDRTRDEGQEGYMIYVGFSQMQKMENLKAQNYINAYINNEIDKMLNEIRPIMNDNKKQHDNEDTPAAHIVFRLRGVIGKYVSFMCSSDMYIPAANNEPDGGHTVFRKAGYIFDAKTGRKIEFTDFIKDYEKFSETLISHLRKDQGLILSHKKFDDIKNRLVYNFDEINLFISLSEPDDKSVNFDIAIPFDDFGQDIFKVFD